MRSPSLRPLSPAASSPADVRRLRHLVPLLVALAALPAIARAADDAPAAAGADAAANPPAAAADATPAVPTAPEPVQAEARYRSALEQMHQAHFVEALDLDEGALRADPSHQGAQKLKDQLEAILGKRQNKLLMAAEWFKAMEDVKTQEVAVRLDALVSKGDSEMAAGDYAAAELDYDRVEVGLRSFPYAFDWGGLPEQITGKRLEARAQARREQDARDQQSRQDALKQMSTQVELQEEALKAKVDELMRRARNSFDRQDYKRAEIDAWNAYELDRRRDDARDLYLKARREGHIQFDDHYQDERQERIARVNEEIHKALIPQTELLIYPEDWQRRALRRPREIGGTSQEDEPWQAAIRQRMDQRLTVDFSDTSFEDVVTFLRQVTQVNIVVDPAVIGAGGGGTVSLKAQNMKFGDVLNWILEQTSLHMALQNQAIYISNTAVSGSISLRMYDVTDLISPVRDFAGRELAYSAGAGAGIQIFQKADDTSKAPDPQVLVDFIKKNLAPKSWDADGAGIEQRGGSTLFVSQTPEVHEQLDRMLASLRNQQALQVNVDVRLLDVRKNFYEEIGFDYQNSPANLLNSSSGSGYERVNSSNLTTASLNNAAALPSNATSNNYTQFGPGQPRGLELQVGQSPFNFFSVDQVNAIFSAVEEEDDLQILEHPSITCFNGQRANAAFMTQYAYIADYDVVSSTLEPKVEILTFGNILDVRPVVSSDHKYITMEIRPASVLLEGVFTETLTAPRVLLNGGVGVFLGFFDYPLELPNVAVRTMRASVMIPDKGSLLIGGFEHSLSQRTETGIPFLSHIPFLGRLFTRNGVYDENRKIFFLLNATIIDIAEQEAQQ